MKIGFCLPHESEAMGGDTATGAEVMRFARRAEEVGFDSVWLVDHFCYSAAGELEALGASAPPELAGRVYGAWECMVTAGALARETQPGGDRNPGGEHGLPQPRAAGAHGGHRRRAERRAAHPGARRRGLRVRARGVRLSVGAAGRPFSRRRCGFIRPLLRGEKVTFEGEFYTTHEAENIPKGPRESGPPIMIGVLGRGPG